MNEQQIADVYRVVVAVTHPVGNISRAAYWLYSDGVVLGLPARNPALEAWVEQRYPSAPVSRPPSGGEGAVAYLLPKLPERTEQAIIARLGRNVLHDYQYRPDLTIAQGAASAAGGWPTRRTAPRYRSIDDPSDLPAPGDS